MNFKCSCFITEERCPAHNHPECKGAAKCEHKKDCKDREICCRSKNCNSNKVCVEKPESKQKQFSVQPTLTADIYKTVMNFFREGSEYYKSSSKLYLI